jgi:hypothetical protein
MSQSLPGDPSVTLQSSRSRIRCWRDVAGRRQGGASQAEGSGAKLAEKEDVEDLLGRLNLHGDETEDFV